MINSPYEKYRQTSVQTSNPGQLVILLYDGAIRFVRTAVEAIRKQDMEQANLNFGKAQNIISELMATLDPAYDISKSLLTLYDYMKYLLIQANVKKNEEPAVEVLGYLQQLRETWVEAGRKANVGLSGTEHG